MNKTQAPSPKLQTGVHIISSLVIVSFIMILALYFGKDTAKVVTNWIYVPVPGAVVILSILLAIRHGTKGDHGKAWILFSLSMISWFIAEQIWLVYDLVYQEDPFPSSADFFYMGAYVFFFAFSLYYLHPVKNAITKKMIGAAIAVSAGLLVPTAYYLLAGSDYSSFDLAVAASYPILDAITLVPSMIAIMLFLGGRVNFMWSLVMIGMLIFVAADTGFLAADMNGEYFTGHPIDILYLWSYIFFAFGVRDHMKIFKKRGQEERFNDQEDMR